MTTTTAAALIALLLVVYPNLLAWLVARRSWDQWQAFTAGNALLGLSLLAYAAVAGLLPAVWGRVTGSGLALGLLGGALPLAVILALMFLPGQLGRDIVAAGVGTISARGFLYRVGVQVALTTVLCEEFAFRGVLYALLLHVVSVAWVIGLTAAAYGLWHAVLQYNGFSSQRGAAHWVAAAGSTGVYVLLGVLLALVRQGSGGLLPAIIAHGVLDVFMFIGMYVRRGQLVTQR